jgi:hypothetical protein
MNVYGSDPFSYDLEAALDRADEARAALLEQRQRQEGSLLSCSRLADSERRFYRTG